MTNSYANLRRIVLASLFCCCLFPSVTVAASLVGDASLTYVNYDANVNGNSFVSASSFVQRYSLRYATNGALAAGRLGRYKMSLGYEWISFDSRLKDNSVSPGTNTEFSASTGHFLYNGDILIDPANLPLRLKLFSRENQRAVVMTDTVQPIIGQGYLIAPGISTSLMEGTRRTSGITMDLGVTSAMEKGYSPIFSLLPLFKVDYSEDVNRDLKSFIPTDIKLRKLAFVSVNKKENWLHIRSVRYDDYIRPSENFSETQVIFGTVDQNLQRKWIDFTNWIKLSADAQFTKRKDEINKSEVYDINLFGKASRSRWEARLFNNFSRTVDNYGIKYDTRIPLYLSGLWGSDTDWRVRISSEQTKAKQYSAGYDSSEILASLRIDTLKRSLFNLSQTLSVEEYERTGVGKTLAMESRTETASSRALSSVLGFFGSYSVKYFNNEFQSQTSANLRQEIAGKAVYTPSTTVRAELLENIVISKGNDNDVLLTTLGQANTNNRDTFTSSGDYVEYQTSAKVDWEPLARLRIGFTISDDVWDQSGKQTDNSLLLGNNISYAINSYSISLNTVYQNITRGGVEESRYSGEGSVRYSPDRTLESSIRYYYGVSDSAGHSNSNAEMKQETNYYIYTMSGAPRRIFELNQSLDFLKNTYTNQQTSQSKALSLGFSYYPLSKLFISARGKYTLWDNPVRCEQMVFYTGVGFNFEKMQANLDYSYGRQNGNGNRLERRVQASLRKVF